MAKHVSSHTSWCQNKSACLNFFIKNTDAVPEGKTVAQHHASTLSHLYAEITHQIFLC